MASENRQTGNSGSISEFYDPGFDELFAELTAPRPSPVGIYPYDEKAAAEEFEKIEKSWSRHAARNK